MLDARHILFLSLFGCSNTVLAGWVERQLPEEAQQGYGKNYLVHLPDDYAETPTKKWPLIVFLHGMGEWGNNLSLVKKRGLAHYLEQGNSVPAVVLALQSPRGQPWHPLFIDAVMKDADKHFRFDKQQVYLTGLSMGGIGSWSAAIAFPHRFAAIAPIAGCLYNDIVAESMGENPPDASRLQAALERIKHIPSWVFHGSADYIVPTALGERSAALFKQAGGNPRLTIYPMVDHDSWTTTYSDNPEFYPWLFAQRNPKPNWDEARPAIRPERYTGTYAAPDGTIHAEVHERNGMLIIKWLNEKQDEALIALDASRFVGTGLLYFEAGAQRMETLVYPGKATLSYKP